GPAAKRLDSDDASAAEVEHGGPSAFNCDAVASHSMECKQGHHLVTCGVRLLQYDLRRFPRRSEVAPKASAAIKTPVHPAPSLEDARSVELELRIHGAQLTIEIGSVPPVKPSLHSLHVLLRHRYSDSPAASRAFFRSVKDSIRTSRPSRYRASHPACG